MWNGWNYYIYVPYLVLIQASDYFVDRFTHVPKYLLVHYLLVKWQTLVVLHARSPSLCRFRNTSFQGRVVISIKKEAADVCYPSSPPFSLYPEVECCVNKDRCTGTRLAYNWIAHQLQVGTSLGRRHNLVRFQIWDQFWIPQPKLHGAMYLIFSCKT